MSMPTVSISEPAHRLLTALAQQTGQTPTEILDRALDDYHRKVFIDAVNAGYAALRADPAAWAEELADRQSMDGCLMDGLDPTECWGENGDLLKPEKANG